MDRLRAMEVFVRVAECGSFSRAAESLDLANATVTACIHNLEQHLRVSLITRNSRGLRLTEEGEMYLPRARELLRSLAHAEDAVQSQRSALQGALRVECTIQMGQTILSPLLPAFTQRYPDISISVTLTNKPHNLIESAIDVAVRYGWVEEADLVARPLLEVRSVICGRPDIVRSLPEHPADLDPKICIGNMIGESPVPTVWHLERGESKVVIEPRGRLHFNDAVMARAAAQGGAGLAYTPELYARPYFESGALERAYPDWQSPPRTIYFVTTKDRASSAKVRAFMDFVFDSLDPWRERSLRAPVLVKALHKR